MFIGQRPLISSPDSGGCRWIVAAHTVPVDGATARVSGTEYSICEPSEGLCLIVGETKPMFMSPEALDFCHSNSVCECVFMDVRPFFTSFTFHPHIHSHSSVHLFFIVSPSVNLKPDSRRAAPLFVQQRLWIAKSITSLWQFHLNCGTN